MPDPRELVYLAGLLHDIGKFNPATFSDYASPTADNDIRHVQGTYDFFRQPLVKEAFKKAGFTLASEVGNPSAKDTLEHLAARHHQPQSDLQALVQLADWWSSGMNRDQYYQSVDQAQLKKPEFAPLQSVFEQLTVVQQSSAGLVRITNSTQEYGYPIAPLSIEGSIFPQPLDQLNGSALNQHWQQFLQNLTQVTKDLDSANSNRTTRAAFSETLTFLLRKYTNCLPAGINLSDLVGVSLYDHLRSCAAIAQCLYDYREENPEAFSRDEVNGYQRLTVSEKHYPLILFCGDISGIQKYIYNIHSSRAAKSMKGRSFYLQLLVESLLQRIIDDCKVTYGHVVYASGGKFYMLLPNLPRVLTALKKIEQGAERAILDEHHGELYVCMDYVPFTYQFAEKESSIRYEREDNKPYTVGNLWGLLSNKTALKKQQKFRSLLVDDFDSFFTPQGVGGVEGVCAVTGVPFDKKSGSNGNEPEYTNRENIGRTEGTDVFVLKEVKQQVDLGTTLKNADYFFTYREHERTKSLSERSLERYTPLKLGTAHHLFNSRKMGYNYADFRKIAHQQVTRVRRINKIDEFSLVTNLEGSGAAYGFTFYGGNLQALNEHDQQKTFEELAGTEESSYAKLGILRMDVDGLGKIFQEGISEQRRNFAIYATLSNQLDLFFSGYLNTIRDEGFVV